MFSSKRRATRYSHWCLLHAVRYQKPVKITRPKHRLGLRVLAAFTLFSDSAGQMVTTLSSAVRVCGFLAGVHLLGLSVEAASLSTQWQHHTRDVQPGVSEQVIELDVPVLIINTEGELELAEGLDTVQVVQEGCPLCQQNLMANSFANSYGAPYVGTYAPPSCDFNRVTWNMTVVSNGTQYDRLGTVWLGDVEVLRTSTAEPGGGAIGWTYLKVGLKHYLHVKRK